MAQASGLFNVIRQVGGSVGIAILGAVEARQIVVHTAAYGQAVDPAAPAVRAALGALQAHAMHAGGSGTATAATQARSLLYSRLATEAFVRAVCDCFLIAGAVTLVGVLPVLLMRVRRRESSVAPAPSPAE
jgi:DHA2 family multidrug resistance protein